MYVPSFVISIPGGFWGGSFAYTHSILLILAEANPFSLFHHLPPNTPMYISQNKHIRTHRSFWHLLCYALLSPSGCAKLGLTPKASRQAITEIIWVRKHSKEKKKKRKKEK